MAIERIALWIVRLVAIIILFAGLAALVAGGFLMSLPAEIPILKTIVGITLEIAGLLVIAGGVGLFLSRSPRPLLPNERMAAGGDERPTVGGWLILLALALVALPIGLVVGLSGFLAGWRELTALLDTLDIWHGANANMSGVILVPLAGALAPALIEWVAMALFVLAAVVLLASLSVRSPGFPRAYLAWGVLLAALVVASVRGADAVMATAQVLEHHLAVGQGKVDETAALRDGIGRYAAMVGSAAAVLVWALGFYLMWLPAILYSRRARTTFAPIAHSPDIESVTRHPQSRY